DLERCLEVYTSNFDARKPFNMEYRLKRKDGEYRWLMDIGKPTYSAAGEFTGYLGSCTDIHEQKTLNEALDSRAKERTQELLEVNVQLKRLNDELQQFAYVASHDLQEPLRKISTYSNIMQQRFRANLPEAGIQHLDKMSAAADRMSLLVDDLLNFARSTRKESEFVRTDLNKIYQNVILDFDLLISENHTKLEVGPLPVIKAIPLQMTQLFRNLISNALKFSAGREKPVVSIASKKASRETVMEYIGQNATGEYCEIVFQDNGIGFPPEFSEQIFVIFKRLHDKQSYPGTGIGLALCRRIVVNHGGEIFAVSNENQGAAFHVLLPVVHPGKT
ncbi:MAG: ATP-binding protein, partial [Saprospiraceae bacterium]